MDPLIDAIRAAVADGAPDDARQAGVTACRAILAALDAEAGQPLALRPTLTSPIVATVSALRTVPPDQLIDLLIGKLRAALPDSAAAPHRPSPLRIPLVPIPERAAGTSGPRPALMSVAPKDTP
jgi:hypothetical protein